MMFPDGYDDDPEDDGDDDGRLAGFGRLGALIRRVPWFARAGTPLDPGDRRAARAWLDALGFPEIGIGRLPGWSAAIRAAANPGIDSEAWQAEAQMRLDLGARAVELWPPDELEVAFAHIAMVAAEAATAGLEPLAARAPERAARVREAAVGAAAEICHQAALVLAAGEEDDHPFVLKFRLYERGRWPVAVPGGTLALL